MTKFKMAAWRWFKLSECFIIVILFFVDYGSAVSTQVLYMYVYLRRWHDAEIDNIMLSTMATF